MAWTRFLCWPFCSMHFPLSSNQDEKRRFLIIQCCLTVYFEEVKLKCCLFRSSSSSASPFFLCISLSRRVLMKTSVQWFPKRLLVVCRSNCDWFAFVHSASRMKMSKGRLGNRRQYKGSSRYFRSFSWLATHKVGLELGTLSKLHAHSQMSW